MTETGLYFSFKKSSRFYSEGFLSYFTTILTNLVGFNSPVDH